MLSLARGWVCSLGVQKSLRCYRSLKVPPPAASHAPLQNHPKHCAYYSTEVPSTPEFWSYPLEQLNKLLSPDI